MGPTARARADDENDETDGDDTDPNDDETEPDDDDPPAEANDVVTVELVDYAFELGGHTFEVEGAYEFVCTPHEAVRMFDTIEVVTDADAPGEPFGPQVPEEAMTLAIGTTFALVATLGFAYVFLKYGSGGPNGGG